jgi:iron complex outermembrane recepter protein
MTDGISRNQQRVRRIAIAVLLGGTAVPVCASSATTAGSAAAADAQPASDDRPQDIIVTGHPLFPDIQPERNLDPTAIESYGVSTVDELLAELQAELGDDEEPLILVNGERINDLSEIGSFPIEVLRNLQVLPRGSAVRAGGTSGQRLVSLTLNRSVRTATATVAPKVATDGDWHSVRAEGILTRIVGSTRANIALRARGDSSLLESERGLLQPDPSRPFAQTGNVIGFPDLTGEIDPLLSALAGHIVTVAPVPASTSPTLAGFAAGADHPAITDLGQFRTLRPNTDNYDFNGTFTTPLTPWLTSTTTFRLNHNTSRSLRGLPNALFVLPATNAFSPFSRDVALAFYGPAALHSRSTSKSGEGNLTLNARFGQWVGNFNARHSESRSNSLSERQAQFGSILLGDTIDPFGADLSPLIPLRVDTTSSESTTNLLNLTLTGPALLLPAGPLTATVEGRLGWNSLRSRSTFSTVFGDTKFDRSEQSIRGAVEVPLTSRENGVLPQIGNLSATAEGVLVHFSDAGDLHRYAVGLAWEPIAALRLRGSIENTESPPSIQLLGNPVLLTPDVRTFDPLTGQTVDVTQITGGVPELRPQDVKIKRLSALLRLLPSYKLQLNAEYTDTNTRNFVSSLPEASAAVMLAFPDRFVRDSSGNLVSVDLRPVNFDSDREKRLRWGLSLNKKIAGGITRPAATPGGSAERTPTTYLQLSANHTVVFSDKIVIRSGLDPVDLLSGGAIGIGGGRLRHQVDGTAALTSGGLGVRVGAAWRGASTLDTRIGGVTDTLHFSPVFLLNLRAFADMRRLLPHSNWARGLRLSLDVLNLTNDRQRVRDSFGNTPLQYQPAYRDPLGRTIEFEIRKVF